MRPSTESWRGRVALMIGHCAGMIDLVAIPVWVGALIGRYGFSPQQAGGLATLFLLGAVASSLVFAPHFNRIDARLMAVGRRGLPGRLAVVRLCGDGALPCHCRRLRLMLHAWDYRP
jgi:MFS family permease